MQKIIFYIKAFFLIIHELLKRGYEPYWVLNYDPEVDYIYDEVEAFAATGGLDEFVYSFVREFQLYLRFKFEFGETWHYRNYFYDNYKEQKMLNRKH